jgi:hypothetical protein
MIDAAELERKFLRSQAGAISAVESDPYAGGSFESGEPVVPEPVITVPQEERGQEITLDEMRVANAPDMRLVRPDGVPNVKEVFLRRARDLGVPRVSKVTGRPPALVQRWLNEQAVPNVDDLQKFLDQPMEAEWKVNRACLHIDTERGDGTLWANKPKLAVAVLMASNRDLPKPVAMSLGYYLKNSDLQWFYADQAILVHARNELAKRFLDSANVYSLWWDDDIFPPFENPGMFRNVAQPTRLENHQAAFNALDRLLSHQKDIVSATYASRRKNGPLTMQPDLAPKNIHDREVADSVRQGRATGIVEVDWVALGFVLIHRRVFETILQKGLAPEDRGFSTFFNPIGNTGEDFSFCQRARQAGFKMWQDLSLEVGHVGRQIFLPADSKRPQS